MLDAVTPDANLWSTGATDYRTPFLNLVDADPIINTAVPLDRRRRVLVHTDKTGTGLALDLAVRGLARHSGGPEWQSWYEVEERTANLLMAYLAGLLVQARRVR